MERHAQSRKTRRSVGVRVHAGAAGIAESVGARMDCMGSRRR